MFIRNAWYVGAWDHEIGRTDLLRRQLLGDQVVMFRELDGTPVALEDRCCHRHAPLSKGVLVEDRIQCPYHGLQFNSAGDCVHIPGQAAIPPEARVRSYPTVERYHWIWIWMGDPALADPDLIEDFHWADDPDYRARGELLHLEGNYVLLVENLLDLSHLSFIHPTTLGTDAIADTAMKSEREGDLVRVTRWIMDNTPPPFFERAGGFKPDDRIDRWQIITFTPPGFVRLDVGGAVAGSGAETGDRSQGFTMRNLNAITPESETTTHYFWAQAHDFRTDEPWITNLLYENVHTAFLEDLDIIGAQQANVLTRPDAPRVDINHDGGGIQARRVIERLVAEEQEAMAQQAAE